MSRTLEKSGKSQAKVEPTVVTDGASAAHSAAADAARTSAYDVAQEQFNLVADFVKLSDDVRGYLSMPQRELGVHFPVEMDDGSIRFFRGYRVQHNTFMGPSKGGIRSHQDVTGDECRALAMWINCK